MASTGTSFSVLAVFFIVSPRTATGAFISMQCNAESVGQHGQQSLLECLIRPTQDIKDVKVRVVAWKREKSEGALLLFNRVRTEQPGARYLFAEPQWNDRNLNVSLLITNTAVKDEGVYSCVVMTDSGDATGYVRLKVTARYNAPTMHSTPEAISPNTGGTLTCSAHGGYPEGQLRWYDEHNTEWTKSAEMEAKQTAESKLFNLSSKLILLPGSTFSKYTCVVHNASGGKEDETTFPLDASPPEGREQGKGSIPASNIVAPVVVIGSLIVGLLMVLLYKRRSRSRDRRETPTYDSNVEEDDHQEKYQDSLA